RVTLLAPLPFAVDMGSGAELDVAYAQAGELRGPEAGLHGDHQLNANLSFRTTLFCDATGTGLYLHKHTRPARNPLRRKGGSV
ncbi:MAG TPA: hypothetical protein VIY28_07430, partial [Pseudonocardiaceae bacterium]